MVGLSGPVSANDVTDGVPSDEAVTQVASADGPQANRQARPAKPAVRTAATPMPRARPKVLRKRIVQTPAGRTPAVRLPAPQVQQAEGWRLFPWLSPSSPQRHVARLPMVMGVGF